ncbi:hypothetical protein [Halobellus sp. GM3]|uniref:hypothetical protein n=1 Tax=Halobellus sp. GM3 TaxID=3458410 RepID=UPI00403DFA3B
MLDHDIARIRADRLEAFVRERKRDAEAERIAAIECDRRETAVEATHKIAAYEEVLSYVETKSGDRDGLISIRR